MPGITKRISLDLGDLWQDFKEIANDAYLLWTDPKEAPPTIRTPDAGFLTILDKNNKVVGVFSPDIYELAKINGLIAQEAEAKWVKANPRAGQQAKKKQPFYKELYHADGEKKSAWDLARLPVIYSDYDKKSARSIQKRIEDEFNYRLENNKPLPPIVFKYLIKSDYLKDLHLLKLKPGVPRGIKLNLINPADKTPIHERAAHYIAQRSALVVTLVAVLSLTAATPMLFAASALGLMLAKWCGEDCGLFDLTENLLRDVNIFSKDFRWGEKISVKKTIKTAVLLTALGVTTFGVGSAAYAGIMGLSLWGSAAGMIGAKAAVALQYTLAGFIGGLSAIGTWVGGTMAQRFFWGLGIWDKHIDFTKERKLAPLDKKQMLADKLNKWQHKLEDVLKEEPGAKPRQVHQQAQKAFTHLRGLAGSVKSSVQPNVETRQQSRARARIS